MPQDGNFESVPVFRHEGISILLGNSGIYQNDTDSDKLFKLTATVDTLYYTKAGDGSNITFNTSDLYGEPVLADEYVIFSLPSGYSVKLDSAGGAYLSEQV